MNLAQGTTSQFAADRQVDPFTFSHGEELAQLHTNLLQHAVSIFRGIISNLIEAVRTGMSSMSAMAATGWLLSRRKVEASRLPSGTDV